MRQSLTVGVLSPILDGFYFGAIIAGVTRAASEAGGRVVAVHTLPPITSDHKEHIGAPGFEVPVAMDEVDGFISIATAVRDDYLHKVRAAGKPVVLVSHGLDGFPAPVVIPDNHAGIRAAVEHLMAHGHSRIAFVGNLVQRDMSERLEAYRQTLLDHGIRPDPELLFEAPDNLVPGGRAAAQHILAAGLPSTAIVAATDQNAVGVLTALAGAGLRVPDDQAVVGFDDTELARCVRPRLASVRQQPDDLGELAGKLLLAAIAGNPADPDEYRSSSSFVARDSCGCVNRSLGLSIKNDPKAAATDIGADVTEPDQRLALGLCAVLLGDPHPEQALAAAIRDQAQAIVEIYRATLGDGIAAEPSQLAEITETLWRLNRRGADVTTVMSLINSCASELLGSSTWPEHLHAVVLRTGIALADAETQDQRRRVEVLDDTLGVQYEIDMDLLRRGEDDPRQLTWVSPDHLTAGCLGVWTGTADPDGDRPMRVVGAYDTTDELRELVGFDTTVRAFPPVGLIKRADPALLEVVHVVPVTVEHSDWGLLAILSRIQTNGHVTRDRFSHWASLLAVALDQEEMLASLRRQRADLAQSYQRERGLAETVRASEQRYALAARAANDGLWDWDVHNGTIYYSTRWKSMIGYAEDEIGDSPDEWLRRVHPDDRAKLDAVIAAKLAGDTDALEHQHRLRTARGDYRWMLCRALAVCDADGQATRIVGSLTDVTERTVLEEELRRRALYDQVTSLPNRSFFQDVLTASIGRAARRPDHRFAVLFLDLDGFKVVNDSLGHAIGDRLLVGVAERLRNRLRTGDMAARFGGDEFAVLLDDVQADDIPEVAGRLQDTLRQPFLVDGHQVVVSASIGVALSETGYDNAADVLRDADIAMYRSKTRARGSYTVFNVTMRDNAEQRMRTEIELRAALDNGNLQLHYQPIVELGTGRVAALEALLRWSHPSRGLVGPAEFLPIAEETGLIVPIGHWVVDQVCRDIVDRRRHDPSKRAGSLPVSINISNRQFWHGALLPHIIDSLDNANLDASCLTIEITESVIMHNPELALRNLQQLRAHDLALHIDDFGTGYSSLGSLRQFPIQAVKIDRSFIVALGADDKDTELVSTILTMGRNLGVEVIAEGVETAAQASLLHSLGCRYVQGYYYSTPLVNDAIPAVVAQPFAAPPAMSVARCG